MREIIQPKQGHISEIKSGDDITINVNRFEMISMIASADGVLLYNMTLNGEVDDDALDDSSLASLMRSAVKIGLYKAKAEPVVEPEPEELTVP